MMLACTRACVSAASCFCFWKCWNKLNWSNAPAEFGGSCLEDRVLVAVPPGASSPPSSLCASFRPFRFRPFCERSKSSERRYFARSGMDRTLDFGSCSTIGKSCSPTDVIGLTGRFGVGAEPFTTGGARLEDTRGGAKLEELPGACSPSARGARLFFFLLLKKAITSLCLFVCSYSACAFSNDARAAAISASSCRSAADFIGIPNSASAG
mmetsp:Transcript_2295/g.5392  ORF Transcript_2295/g.5392 Transcript_2295/m.5392 type:complete len:210 (+) Transcript_2295:492-1121(+)